MYKESIRVPHIWNHPVRIRGGRTVDGMVSSYDFFPTILEYLGVRAPAPARQRVGRSYAAFLRGEDPEWRNELYFEYCYTRAVRTRNMKYIERAEEWPDELFDLEADPTEDTNVIGSLTNRERLNALRARLRGLSRASGAPPIARCHDSVRNVPTIDTGDYDCWLEVRTSKE